MNTCTPPRLAVRLLAALCLCAAVLTAQAQGTQRYTVSMQDTVGGHMVVGTDAAGQVQVDYSYRDNGRGPDLKETFTLDPGGAPLSYRGEGKSTFGGPIDDSFAWSGGVATWASPVDHERRPVEAGALYYPIEGSPAWLAQLVRALMQRPDRSAPGLPGGRFTAERIEQTTLPSGTGEIALSLYALAGADLGPTYLWLRDDPSMALFAFTYPGFAVVAQGHEAHGKVLLERQLQANARYQQDLKTRLAQPLHGLLAIRNVRWFDSKAARMRGPADVFVFNGRIASITAPNAKAADVAQQVDGSGKTLLPGLFDMHSHYWPGLGLQHLAAGITSARDLGNDNAALMQMQRQFESGAVAGPRLSANGYIEGRSPFSSVLGIVADDLGQAQAAVDWYAQRGYTQLKLYNSIRPEWVRPLAAHAHALGLRVGGHIPAFMRAEQAVRAGFDEIHHINQLMLNFLVKPGDDTRTLLRFTLVGEQAREVDLSGPQARAFFKLLRSRGTVVDPTAATFEALLTQRNGEPNPSLLPVAAHLPPVVRRLSLSNTMDINAGNAERYRASYRKLIECIGRLHRAGVPLVAGTDTWPIVGSMLHRELELYVQAGIPPAQVLKIATWNGARVTQTLDHTGSIERGKLADLVLVDGDPSQRIADIRRISLVIKGNEAYAPDRIQEALGMRAFNPSTSIVDVVQR